MLKKAFPISLWE